MVEVGRPLSKGGTGRYVIYFHVDSDYQTAELHGSFNYPKESWKQVSNGVENYKYKDITKEELEFMPTWEDYDDLLLWMQFRITEKESFRRYNSPETCGEFEKKSNEFKEKLEKLGYSP